MTIFYEIISRDGQKSYLFGTMHSSNESVNLLSLEVKSAFESTSSLYVEVDPTDSNVVTHIYDVYDRAYQKWWKTFGLDHKRWMDNPENLKRISSLLGTTMDLLKLETTIRNTPIGELLLSTDILSCKTRCNDVDKKPKAILDDNFIRMAKKRGCIVQGLEHDAPYQIPWSEFTYEEQWQLFEGSIKKIKKNIINQDQLQNRYLEDRFVEMEELINQYEEHYRPLVRRYLQRLIIERDKKMVDKLEVPLTRGNAFVAVGAAHIEGMVKILKEKGYTVQNIPLTVRKYPVLDYYERNATLIKQCMYVLIATGVLCIIASMIPAWSGTLLMIAAMAIVCVLVKGKGLIEDYINESTFQLPQAKVSEQSLFKRISDCLYRSPSCSRNMAFNC